MCGSFLSDEVQNTSETTQSQTYEHTHASTLTRNRATFSDQCCRTALSIIADLNRRIELSSVRTLVCLCRTFAGAILLWLKTLARRYVLAVVRRQSSKSIILFDLLVGNMSFREGYPVFLLVPPFLIWLVLCCLSLLYTAGTNLTSNKLPVHGVFLTADVSDCTCQVTKDCLNVKPLHIISDGNSHFPFNDSSYSGLLDEHLVVYASITYRIRASHGIAATDLPRELPLEGLYGGHHCQQF